MKTSWTVNMICVLFCCVVICLDWLISWDCKHLLASVVGHTGNEVRLKLTPASQTPIYLPDIKNTQRHMSSHLSSKGQDSQWVLDLTRVTDMQSSSSERLMKTSSDRRINNPKPRHPRLHSRSAQTGLLHQAGEEEGMKRGEAREKKPIRK